MTTLHNLDNLQTRWSDLHDQVLPVLLALLEIPAKYIFCGDNDISIPWLSGKLENAGLFKVA